MNDTNRLEGKLEIYETFVNQKGIKRGDEIYIQVVHEPYKNDLNGDEEENELQYSKLSERKGKVTNIYELPSGKIIIEINFVAAILRLTKEAFGKYFGSRLD